jgi:hypothetical protein
MEKLRLDREVTGMRSVLLVLMMLLSPSLTRVQTPSPRTASDPAPKIELRLTPETVTIRPGERLKLRVELWNLGSGDVIIAQNVDATFGNSELRLYLEKGSMQEAGSGMVADGIPLPNPDFEETFVTNWLTLNRGHFYGTYVYMDPIDYSHLRKAGHYTVRAEYDSRGISSTPGWNGGYLKQEDVDRLPFPSLKGTIKSNVARIQVRFQKTTAK